MPTMKILQNVSLKPFTTFQLGGRAEYFAAVSTKDELTDAVRFSRQAGIPYMVLGGGSNLLVSDDGYQGLIIRNQIKGVSRYEKGAHIFLGVGAGESWDDLVAYTVKQNLHGIENLSGIPGSVGATPIQNVGAYGQEVQNTISWVEVFNPATMEFELLTNRQCEFRYRDSVFKSGSGKGLIVTEVGFKLAKEGVPNISYRDLKQHFNEQDIRPTLQSVRDAVLVIRAGKFPDLNQHGCGGSFFKNPIISRNQLRRLQDVYPDIPHYSQAHETYKVPLAWVLEHAVPWKGVRRKHVGVSAQQPLILVHYGGGNARDMKRLADDIAHSVRSELNILITPEICFVGNF